MCEGFNRTWMNMLGTLDPGQKSNWKAHAGPMVHAYNVTRHSSTGHAPFSFVCARSPRLAIDLILDLPESDGQTYTKYIAGLWDRLKQSYERASLEAAKSRERQKGCYDARARATVLHPGDRVLVRILAYDGKHKLADKWKNEVYVVVRQPNLDIPVYVIKRENGLGGTRKVHRNLAPTVCQPFAHWVMPGQTQRSHAQSQEETAEDRIKCSRRVSVIDPGSRIRFRVCMIILSQKQSGLW